MSSPWLVLALVTAAAATLSKDPCQQPLKVGPCEALVPRWYYSAKDGKCLEFKWGGCQPNQNNFKTLADCNKQCDPCLQPAKKGPCKARALRYFYSKQDKKCLKFFWGGCDANGNNFATLEACAKQCCPYDCGEPCKQPVKPWPCRGAFPRYYYSAKEGKCLKFSWGGCDPNDNNFKTLAECDKKCNPCLQPRKVGPCRARNARYFFSTKRNRCIKFYWGGCKANGNNFDSLKACKKQCCPYGCGNPCKQPQKVGPCKALVPRWYYSVKDGKCLKFNWGGCQPNGNNFETLADCERKCNPNPCLQRPKKGPCKARKLRYFYSAKLKKCIKFYWGGCKPNGNNFDSLKACKKQCCPKGCGNPCRQPQKVGPCRGAFPRYYYSTKDKKCLKFSWGGCQPNGNNFETLAECEKRCDPCLLPRKSGPCLAAFPRWYYSKKTKKCRLFIWGGCQSNGNNFKSLAECAARCCSGRRCGDFKRPKICYLPSVVGNCRAKIPRYFFDGKKCVQFFYGGCKGNANNFKTIGQCQKVCRVWVS